MFNLEYVYTVAGRPIPTSSSNDGRCLGRQRDDTVSIELYRRSKLLKELKPNPCFYENLPAVQVIWRLLDQVGYTNYAIQTNDLVANHVIPYFWATGEKTIWEILDEIVQATQTAIYFDCFGVLAG